MGKMYEDIYAPEMLYAAWDRVEENDGCAGMDGISILSFGENLDAELLKLHFDLKECTYRPQPLLRFAISKASGGERILCVPTVRDRVAQTAAMLVVGPKLDREFEPVSFAYRRGRSVRQAVYRIKEYRDRGYMWVVDADIEAFFDRVDHVLLMRAFRELIDDEAVADLIEGWVRGEIWWEGKTTRNTRGVPQGSPISPLLANLYLDIFDEELEREGLKLVRYADDFVVLCKDEAGARHALEISEGALADLQLKLNQDKTRITTFKQGFRYLGALFIDNLILPSKEDGSYLGLKPSGRTQVPPQEETPERDVIARPQEERLYSPFMRTLYIQEQGAMLKKEHERLIVEKDDVELLSLPASKIAQIVIFGRCQITSAAMSFCLWRDLPITVLSNRGRYYGRIESTQGDRLGLHRVQFARAMDEGFALTFSKALVTAKLHNARVLLQRHKSEAVQEAIERLREAIKKAETVDSLDALRGCEGNGAAAYFPAFGALLREGFSFRRRVRQPPTDPVNSMLSFGYTLLFYNIFSLLRVHGLDPYQGYLHAARPNHPTLASDLMEEFRTPIVESLVLSLVNQKIVKPGGFYVLKDGERSPCFLANDTRKRFVRAFEEKMHTEVFHPESEFRVDYRRCIALQIGRFIQFLRGDKHEYKPFRIRF